MHSWKFASGEIFDLFSLNKGPVVNCKLTMRRFGDDSDLSFLQLIDAGHFRIETKVCRERLNDFFSSQKLWLNNKRVQYFREDIELLEWNKMNISTGRTESLSIKITGDFDGE